jgi:putative ABC transport system permease protein
MLDSLRFETRTAVRALARRPAFVVTVVLTLALGIGASTAMWSVVEAVLLRPLPFAEPERLVFVWQEDRLTGTTREASSIPDYLDYVARSRTLEAIAAYQVSQADQTHLLRPGHDPERVEVVLVGHDLLAVLGVEPLLGRSFTAAEDVQGGEPVALLAEPLWRSAFDARPDVVGRALRLDDDVFTIVGVVPAGLEVPGESTEVWLPLRQQGSGNSPRWTHATQVVARLAPGVPEEQAREELTAIGAALEREYRENAGRGSTVEPLVDVLRGDVRGSLVLLLWASLLLLLLACTNVANLLLARGAARRRDTAIVAALGAGSGRIAGRFLVEAALLAGGAVAGGLVIARVLLGGLLGLAPAGVARLAPAALRPTVLWFAVALAVLVTVAFTLVPVLQARGMAPGGSLPDALRAGRSEGGTGRARLSTRRVLVVAQFALALVLLWGAGLMLQSLRHLHAVDPGFDASGVLRVSYQLPPSRYPRGFDRFPQWPEVLRFNEQLLERAVALPGVESVALTVDHPLDAGFTNSFLIVGREQDSAEQGELTTRIVSSGYFATNRVELREGRLFGTQDIAGTPMVLLLNEEAVRRYFPDGSPLGQRVRFWGIEREVVGVVENERFHGLDRPSPPTMYAPIAQNPPLGETTLMLRAAAAPESLLGPLRGIVRELDPSVALYGPSTMEETLAGSLRHRTLTARLLGLFAGVALGLAVLGVYGVLSYLVEQRRREVGIRMALGATRGRVVSMVLGEGLALAGVGAALGTLGALGLASLLESLVFGVSPRNPESGFVAAAALLLAAALASFVPASRASRVDPAAALASE